MRQVKRAYQLGRVAIGSAAFVVPSLAGRGFGVELDPGGQVIMRLFGVRDAILGVGQILGEKHGAARGWYEAAAVVDAADAVVLAVGAATGVLPRRTAAVGAVVALSAAVAGLVFARAADGDAAVDALDDEFAELTRTSDLVASD
jgi:hypothetical protein